MDKSYSRPKLPGSARMRLRGLTRAVLAMAVLVAVPLLLVYLFRQEASVRFNGVVESGAENVGPVEAARIVSVEVVEGQAVRAGDVLVRFDSADRLLDDALNDVRLREYEQDLARRRETLAAEARECGRLVHEASVKLEECRMERVREAGELAGLEAEVARIEPLVEKKLVSTLELVSLRPKIAALRESLAHYEPLLAALERRRDAARADAAAADAACRKAADEIAGALESARAAAQRSEELRKADPTVLRALADGVVSKVFRHPGDIVAAGEPVLRVKAGADAVYVTGMLPNGMLEAVHVGDALYVQRLGRPGSVSDPVAFRGRVESIDSEVLDLFDPVNPAPRAPVRGRKARIRVEDAAVLVPGETVVIVDSMPRGIAEVFSLKKPEAAP